MSKHSEHRVRVARNFIKIYGRQRLIWLVRAIAKGESGQAIADELNVSRERVRQWKITFGEIWTEYRLHPETRKILNEINRS